MSFFSTIATGIARRNNDFAERDESTIKLPTWQVMLPRWMALIPSMLITATVLVPILALAWEMATPDLAVWERLWSTVLPKALKNTVVLVGGVSIGTLTIGTGFAWLVTAYEFPFRRWFERLFLLPLAIPGFIMGFTFVAIFEYAGPVQTWLRDTTGSDVSGWFPDISSPGGVILVLTLVLYPYVYLLARAAFREQAASTFEAAQVMGYSRTATFFKLVLPMARPSIAAGTLLAAMEALTDYGTVSFFGYPTLSERVVVLWETEISIGPAVELASMMLFIGLVLIIAERHLRGRAKYFQQGGRGRRMPRHRLTGWQRWTAFSLSSTLLFAAFILPVIQLVLWVINEIQYPSVYTDFQSYSELAGNSLKLSAIAAVIVVVLALIVAYGVRDTALTGSRWLPRALSRLLTLGYAMPGAVIAVGVLAVVNPIDAEVTDFLATRVTIPDDVLYVITGTIIALTAAYVVRFMSVGFGSVESSMEKVTPNMEGAARTLGAGPLRVLRRVHLPLVSAGMSAGAILVFVDVMKELPATRLLAPFGMKTLATEAYLISKEGWWDTAAIYGLTILVVGLVPVLLLMRIGDDRRE